VKDGYRLAMYMYNHYPFEQAVMRPSHSTALMWHYGSGMKKLNIMATKMAPVNVISMYWWYTKTCSLVSLLSCGNACYGIIILFALIKKKRHEYNMHGKTFTSKSLWCLILLPVLLPLVSPTLLLCNSAVLGPVG